jgi:ABC-type bacteriocin/lantibiotic exporter with double-glycine peptidase domain
VHRASLGKEFDHTVILERGKFLEQGSFTELDQPGSVLSELVSAG